MAETRNDTVTTENGAQGAISDDARKAMTHAVWQEPHMSADEAQRYAEFLLSELAHRGFAIVPIDTARLGAALADIDARGWVYLSGNGVYCDEWRIERIERQGRHWCDLHRADGDPDEPAWGVFPFARGHAKSFAEALLAAYDAALAAQEGEK